MSENSVAIVGMAVRVPLAETIDDFWSLLIDGKDCLTRSDVEEIESGSSERFVPVRGALRNVKGFDAKFFGIRPTEAELIDPQHRVFLECAWEALESAGHLTSREHSRVGVFASAGFSTYLSDNVNPSRAQLKDSERLEILMANDKDFLAARVAYKLGLTGPALSVQAACASSLAAVHIACQSIILGESDLALAGGVSIDTSRTDGYFFEPGLTFSSCGVVRSYDRDSDGTVPSAGAGVVLLKRFDDAIRDGDSIYAVILGSAITNDGGMRPALSTPTQHGIERAVRDSLTIAQTSVDEIGYIEGHGSGTMLGDRIEARALSSVFDSRTHREPCLIGSLKSNIGHLDVAAGVVGLIKTALSIHHKFIPRSIHCRQPLDEFSRSDARIRVAQREQPWAAPPFESRKASVNSMGLGGHNVHAVLGEAPPVVRSPSEKRNGLLIWSASDDVAADAFGKKLTDYLEQSSTTGLTNISYSLAACRPELPFRRATVVDRSNPAVSPSINPVLAGHVPAQRSTVGMFSALSGCSRLDDDSRLSRSVLARVIDESIQFVRENYDLDSANRLRQLLVKSSSSTDDDYFGHSIIDRQCASYIFSVALAKQHVAWGLKVDAWSGGGIGEICAAAMSGIFSVFDGLRLVHTRAQSVESDAGKSALLLIDTNVEVVKEFVRSPLFLAIDGGQRFCAIGGQSQDIKALSQLFLQRGITSRIAIGEAAFNTPLMESAATRLRDTLLTVSFNPPNERFDSACLGAIDAGSRASTPDFWLHHLVQPVRFAALLKEQVRSGLHLFVEFGVGGELAAMAREKLVDGDTESHVTSFSCTQLGGVVSDVTLQQDLAKFWVNGASIDWHRHFSSDEVRRVWLPNYAFQRSDYWIDRDRAIITGNTESTCPTYVVSWKPVLRSPSPADADLLIIDLADEKTPAPAGESLSHPAALRLGLREIVTANLEGIVASISRLSTDTRNLAVLTCSVSRFDLFDVQKASEIALTLSILGRALKQTSVKRVVVAVDRAFRMRREDVAHPIGEMIATCTMVLDQEFDGLRWAFVDIGNRWNSLFESLSGVPMSNACILRDGKLYAREVQPFVPPVTPPPLLRKSSTYLITGGSGKIGCVLAQYLVERYEATVVIVGRTTPTPEPTRTSEDENDQILGKLIYVTADICNENAFRIALDRAHVDPSVVRGVFHLASLTAEAALVDDLVESEIQLQFAAKCQGIVVLNKIFAEHSPDFLVVFSSMSSILGGRGLYAYSAACALADGLASCAGYQGLSWSTFNWDGWRTSESSLSTRFALHDYFFESAAALELLDRLLVRGQNSQVLCMRGDFHRRSLEARRKQIKPAVSSTISSDTSIDTGQSSNPVQRIADLWAGMIGRAVGLDAEFFEVGGDSLLAVRIANEVRKQWNVRIPITLFMEQATPRKLANFIATSTPETTKPTPTTPPESRETQQRVSERPAVLSLDELTPILNRFSQLVMTRAYRMLHNQERVAPEFGRLFRMFQQTAITDWLHTLSDREVSNEIGKAADQIEGMAVSTPYEGLVRGIISLGQKMEGVLQGEESALAILFEGGDDSVVSVAYRKMPEAVQVLSSLATLAKRFREERPGHQLRVLELGGGIGVATERVYPLFKNSSDYVFSDISPGFFRPIRERFPEIQCQIVDLNCLCESDAFKSNQRFDLVVAVNALHCARSIQQTLTDARQLINPGGAILVVEAIRNEPWHLLGLGPLKGFLDFTDFRSIQSGPFVGVSSWRDLLSGAKFELLMDDLNRVEFEKLGQMAFIAPCRN